MMQPSVLSPATSAALRGVKPRAPFFSNMITAEMFEAENTRGPFKILPHGDGGYVVFNTSAPLGKGVVDKCKTLQEAKAALERRAAEAS